MNPFLNGTKEVFKNPLDLNLNSAKMRRKKYALGIVEQMTSLTMITNINFHKTIL